MKNGKKVQTFWIRTTNCKKQTCNHTTKLALFVCLELARAFESCGIRCIGHSTDSPDVEDQAFLRWLRDGASANAKEVGTDNILFHMYQTEISCSVVWL